MGLHIDHTVTDGDGGVTAGVTGTLPQREQHIAAAVEVQHHTRVISAWNVRHITVGALPLGILQ